VELPAKLFALCLIWDVVWVAIAEKRSEEDKRKPIESLKTMWKEVCLILQKTEIEIEVEDKQKGSAEAAPSFGLPSKEYWRASFLTRSFVFYPLAVQLLVIFRLREPLFPIGLGL
jgi:hypothetical protein